MGWVADGSILVQDGRRGLMMLPSGQYEPFSQRSKLREDSSGPRRADQAAPRDSASRPDVSYSEWAASGDSSPSGRVAKNTSDASDFRVAASLWSEMDAVRGGTSVVAYHPTVLTHCILAGQVCKGACHVP